MAGDGGEGDDAAVTKAGLQAANATTSQRRRNPPARAPHTGTRQAPQGAEERPRPVDDADTAR